MYPKVYAERFPDKPAQIMAESGEVLTYRELNDRSNQLAQLMWAAGLRPGDHVSVFMENNPRYLEAVWAVMRSGLYLTTVNRYLTAEEAAYIVNDSGSQVLVTSAELGDVAKQMVPLLDDCPVRLVVDDVVDGFERYEEAVEQHPAEPLADEPMGEWMLYSSGTTGKPKGIKRPVQGGHVSEGHLIGLLLQGVYGFTEDTVYLCPAPLYHSAPLGFSMGTQMLGGTLVIMEKFEPVEALRSIERFRVTHSQWVPTMFSRMLKLPDETRTQFDLSSQQVVIHAAAPCPPDVKQAMIDWWGPIIHEYYAATELNGFTNISSEEWLQHRGSVGKPLIGTIHICDEEGNELPVGESGLIYFEQEETPFEYHNDSDKTKSAQHPEHPNWTKLGDIGRVDEDGYLYLTDRTSNLIISGGVNIYPQEIENVLIMHPAVVDVAVIGVPNEDFGEEIKAVVVPQPDSATTPALADELIGYARENLASYKVPRSVDFLDELPRLPTGKLYKRLLRDRYWEGHDSRLV